MATSAAAATGCVIKVDGTDLAPEQLKSLLEVKVQENVMLPAVATIRMVASDAGSSNPKTAVDQSPFKIGNSLEVQLGSLGDRGTKKVFKGEIVSEEPIFEAAHAEVTVRAYDKAHRLNRDRKTRTFQDVTAGDIVSTVAGDHGLSPDVESTNDTFKYVQQSMETDWELLWRLALMYDRELVVDDRTLKFRKGAKAYGTEVTLTYTDNLTAFRPRITGAAEVKKVTVRGWDIDQKQAIVGESQAPTLRSDAPASSAHGKAATDVGASANGTLISDQAPVTVGHAKSIATSMMQRLASASIEAEGSAFGLPTLRAGINVKIEGVGARFSGKYRLSSVTHLWRAAAYTTHFAINGVAARGLLDLVQPKAQPSWGSHLHVGVVSANDDPDGMGRVRVKIPVLSDSDESWWARVLTPSAGASHGIYSLPAVGDEVIIGFESGNSQRPYVLGSLFNGKDKPIDDMVTGHASGSHGNYVHSSQEKILTHSVKETEIKSDKPMLLESKDTMTVKADKDQTIKSSQKFTLEAGSSITIKATGAVKVESSASLEVKGSTVTVDGGSSLTLKGGSIMIG